jgi:hypothetical protein
LANESLRNLNSPNLDPPQSIFLGNFVSSDRFVTASQSALAGILTVTMIWSAALFFLPDQIGERPTLWQDFK